MKTVISLPPHEELRLCQEALQDWGVSRFMTVVEKSNKNVCCGLCFYFNVTHHVNIYGFHGYMPVLEMLIQERLNKIGGMSLGEDGVAKPRMDILKQAISILKTMTYD